VAVWQGSRLTTSRLLARFSAHGYLFFLLGTAVAAIVAREAEVVLVLAGTLFFAGLLHRATLKLLCRWQLWLFFAPTLLLSPLLIGDPDISLWGVGLSAGGFWAGLWMTLRALSIALAARVFAGSVSVAQMASLLEGTRLKGLGFALGVATNVLPTIQETMETSYQAIRLRGGFRAQRWETLKLLLVSVIAGSLRRGDDIVSAAEARAFDPNRSQGSAVPLTHADLALAAAFLVLVAAMLLT
jgi:energy-coupling factor transporter transmembrane protein EcfT